MKKINIQPSFIIAFVIFFILGYINIFLMLLLFVTLHEVAHIIVARKYGATVKRIRFFAFGESAELHKIEMMTQWERIKMYLSGPFLNLAFGTVFLLMRSISGNNNEVLLQLITINFVLCFFNLLPICPLDGGRILHTLLGNWSGILKSGKVMKRIGEFAGALFIVMGTVQLVLFPINVSLLCIGIFVLHEGKKSMSVYTNDLFLFTAAKDNKISKKKVMTVKTLVTTKDSTFFELLTRITWDNYSVFYVYDGGNIAGTLTEIEITEYALLFSNSISLGEILENDKN